MVASDAHTGLEVLEEDASPKVKQIFDEVKSVFRASTVNLVFRTLAVHPDYLELSWRQLRPNVQTLYFERQADEIRAVAARGMAHLGAPPRPNEDASHVLRVFHYMDPKLLIAVAALRSATTGSLPVLRLLPTMEKRQIVFGTPSDMSPVPLLDAETDDDLVRSIFEEMITTLGQLPDDYRALARWPEYLGWAWQSTRSVAHHPAYRKLLLSLRRQAEEAVLAFPFRVDCSPHTLRLCGISESEMDAVRDTLDKFYRLLLGLVADIAFLSVGEGGDFGAEKSPFPVFSREL